MKREEDREGRRGRERKERESYWGGRSDGVEREKERKGKR